MTTPIPRSTRRRDALIIGMALISVGFYVLVMRALGGNGFPLDDSWIHQTYGRNLAQTGRWEYIPGVASAGSTSPFFTVLLAAGYWLHLPYMLWTYLLGIGALALAGLSGARLAEQLFPTVPNIGLWTGLALVTTWHLVWAAVSGMETMLFGALCLLLIEISWRDRLQAQFGYGLLFGLLSAILIATRPEGILLIGLIGLVRLISGRPGTLNWIIGAAIGGAVGIIPYILHNYSLNGTLLPNTFSAKQAENAPLLAQPFIFNLWAMIQPLTAGAQLLLVPGVVVTMLRLARNFKIRDALYFVPILWSLALILLYTLRLPAPYQHGRYVMPALPTLIVFGVGGTFILAVQRRKLLMARVLVRGFAFTAFGLFIVFWWLGARIFGEDVKMIDSEMVAAANWLATPGHVNPNDLLAVHDIGAVGYFAPRPILDLAGLVSPEVIPIILDNQALDALMQHDGVRYLMVLPSQTYQVFAPDDPRLCERFNANGRMGGMHIYEIAWDGHCP